MNARDGGEVEILQSDVTGVAVHAAARVLTLARDTLKGLEGEREVFRVIPV